MKTMINEKIIELHKKNLTVKEIYYKIRYAVSHDAIRKIIAESQTIEIDGYLVYQSQMNIK